MPELSFIGLQIKFGERNKVISAEAVNLPRATGFIFEVRKACPAGGVHWH